MSDDGSKRAAIQCMDTAVKKLNSVGSAAQAFQHAYKEEMVTDMIDVMRQLEQLTQLADAYEDIVVPKDLYEGMNKTPPEHPCYKESFLGKLANEVGLNDQKLQLLETEMNKMQQDILLGTK